MAEEHEDIESILEEAWERIRSTSPSKEDLENAKFFIDGKELDSFTEEGEIGIKGNFKREQYLYEHLFALIEKAILSCNGKDVDEACRLVEAYDTLLAIGLAMGYEENDQSNL